MIVSKNKVLVDAKNGIESEIYINVTNQLNNSKEISFDVECFTISYKEVEKEKAVVGENGLMVIGENGMPVVEVQKILVPEITTISKEKAVFKPETYHSKIGVFNSEEFETAFVNQLDFLKKFDWSKTDKKPVGFFGLGSKDVKIISRDEFKMLITNKTVK